MSPSSDDESSIRFPIRQILLAIVAYYAFVTYQFFRVRFFIDYYAPIGYELSPEQMRMAIFSYFNIDPSASIPVQWLTYLVNATGGYWSQSINFGEFVKFMLDLTLLWVGFIAAVAIVAGLIADWIHPRLGINGLSDWTVTYGAYVAVFLAVFVVLCVVPRYPLGYAGPRNPLGLYLIQPSRLTDIPLQIGIRRLLAIGFLGGAVIVSIRRWYHRRSNRTTVDTIS